MEGRQDPPIIRFDESDIISTSPALLQVSGTQIKISQSVSPGYEIPNSQFNQSQNVDIRSFNLSDQVGEDDEQIAQTSRRIPSFLQRQRRKSLHVDDDLIPMSNFSNRDKESVTNEKKIQKDYEIDQESSQTGKMHNRLLSIKRSKRFGMVSQLVSEASSRVVNLANVSMEQHQKERSSLTDTLGPSSMKNLASTFKDSLKNEEFASQQKQGVGLDPPNFSSCNIEPLKGYSLGIFSPNNSIRLWFYGVLNKTWTEPIILCFIVIHIILLVADAWVPFEDSPNAPITPPNIWGSSWTDYGLLIVFTIFT
ncbi:7816_t:CDS:2 [Acaulospora colombiana]|uniref:7816_t:CDS:1 n=1 Tax=Acaulospora colombiana TaxID=27376 RepID=A0ACA9LG36_9GLOM|nr:7816_t:CDS:2 [Acaulospora colombiana]